MQFPQKSETVPGCELNDSQTTNLYTFDTHCNASWDGYLCWKETPADQMVKLGCPPRKGFDTRYFATRYCDRNGFWNGKMDSDSLTNFSECFTPELRRLYSIRDLEAKRKIAEKTRNMEFAGYSSSLLFLSIALFIFFHFRALKTHKTHIHKNLFAAVLIQVLVRLIVYVDQIIIKSYPTLHGIDNTAGLCESFYVLLEFGRTAMFTWFLVEGLYLNQLVAISVFAFNPNYFLYYFLGWGVPLTLTAVWTGVMSAYMNHTSCWSFYNLTPYFWIVEGPRFLALFINLLVLLNTLRILLTTVKESAATKPRKIVKALKAGFVLIPLLGISNVLQMINVPDNRSATEFAVWAFTSHFLSSFQGFIISFIYCFFNKEVQTILKKRWRCYRAKSLSRNDFGASMKSRASMNGDPHNRSLRATGKNSRRNLDQDEFTSHIRMSSFKYAKDNLEIEEGQPNGNLTAV